MKIKGYNVRMTEGHATQTDWSHKDKSNLDKSWDRILERNVEGVVVVCQWVKLIILDQFHDWRELQRLNKPKLAVLMEDLYQLVTASFPVNSKTFFLNFNPQTLKKISLQQTA